MKLYALLQETQTTVQRLATVCQGTKLLGTRDDLARLAEILQSVHRDVELLTSQVTHAQRLVQARQSRSRDSDIEQAVFEVSEPEL
jgi:hypothetical protein